MSLYGQTGTFGSAATRLIDRFQNPQTINVERNTVTTDGAGGNSSSWAAVKTGIKAAVIPFKGEEAQRLQRLDYMATHKVYMTWSDAENILAGDRLVFGSRVLSVVDPRNVGEAGALARILCEEGAGN